MPDLRSELAPISEAVTNNIRVEGLSRYSPENSQPLQSAWIFQYTVRITNQGAEPVQLISRHWIITDALTTSTKSKAQGLSGSNRFLRRVIHSNTLRGALLRRPR